MTVLFNKGMSNEQFDSHLETLARLIEASAKTVEDAARIVREAKTTCQRPKEEAPRLPKGHPDRLDFQAETLAVPEIHVEESKTARQ